MKKGFFMMMLLAGGISAMAQVTATTTTTTSTTYPDNNTVVLLSSGDYSAYSAPGQRAVVFQPRLPHGSQHCKLDARGRLLACHLQ